MSDHVELEGSELAVQLTPFVLYTTTLFPKIDPPVLPLVVTELAKLTVVVDTAVTVNVPL
jgi:hypothetical protein